MSKFIMGKHSRTISSLSRKHFYLFSILSFVVDSMQSVEQVQICTISVRTRYRYDLNVPEINLSKWTIGETQW